MFILDGNGVPSVAKMVRINVAAVPNPAIMPTLINPGNRTDQAGANVSVQLNASDPNGDTLTFAATGLPPGITINSATGQMSGTPTAQGRGMRPGKHLKDFPKLETPNLIFRNRGNLTFEETGKAWGFNSSNV